MAAATLSPIPVAMGSLAYLQRPAATPRAATEEEEQQALPVVAVAAEVRAPEAVGAMKEEEKEAFTVAVAPALSMAARAAPAARAAVMAASEEGEGQAMPAAAVARASTGRSRRGSLHFPAPAARLQTSPLCRIRILALPSS